MEWNTLFVWMCLVTFFQPPGCYWQNQEKSFSWKEERSERTLFSCLGKVCRPLQLGGLGISSLKELCWALKIWWLWLKKTDLQRPWATLPIQVPKKALNFFARTVSTEVGDGANTLFWKDSWLHGKRLADMVPRLYQIIPRALVNKRTKPCKIWIGFLI